MKLIITEEQFKQLTTEGSYINIPLIDDEISLEVWEDDNKLELSQIVIPKNLRGQGLGTKTVLDVIKYADSVNKPLFLTPDTSLGGTSFNRLVKFYKQLGFKKNTDQAISQYMVKYPSGTVNEIISQTNQFINTTQELGWMAEEDEQPRKVIYSAIFVDKNELKGKYKPVYPNIYSHHSTISIKPDISGIPIGETVKMKIIGRLTTDKVDVLLVENKWSTNEYPHITLSTNDGIKPYQSNIEIKNNLDKIKPLNDSINGRIGYFDGKEDIMESKVSEKQKNQPYTTRVSFDDKIYITRNKTSVPPLSQGAIDNAVKYTELTDTPESVKLTEQDVKTLVEKIISRITEEKQADSYPTEEEINKYKIQETNKINAMTTDSEVQDYIRNFTMGYHFPLNPVEPVRSALRNKITQMATKENHLASYLPAIEGEWKEIVLPPGAVH